jgi:hypothetical protein
MVVIRSFALMFMVVPSSGVGVLGTDPLRGGGSCPNSSQGGVFGSAFFEDGLGETDFRGRNASSYYNFRITELSAKKKSKRISTYSLS